MSTQLRRPEARARELPYLPGLDGLRALAVVAVLLYHADVPWLPGGFLGVEVFFTISGYLITGLLLREWEQRGRISFKTFWLRRARRLLPALYLLLIATLAFAVMLLPGEVAGLRGDALAAFGYVTNWYLVLGHKSYFETVGRPSLLQHLWSLAVEEQFYLLWPLLFSAGMRRCSRQRMLLAILIGALVSTVLMAILYRPGVDPSRLYYGTDTRAAGLLLGAALAFIWLPGGSQQRTSPFVPLLLDVIGLVALVRLIWFFHQIDESQRFLYRGGFALIALTTAVIIAVVVHPRAHIGKTVLGLEPLRWLGLRSYGIYLWHWPIFMITRPQLDLPIKGLPLLILRLSATVLFAEFSYRYVETPLRTGAMGRAWRDLWAARGQQRMRLAMRWGATIAIGLTSTVLLGKAVAHARPPALPAYLSTGAIHSSTTASTGVTTTTVLSPTTGLYTGHITAIGDSVMLGAHSGLEQSLSNLDIDAEIGRQTATAIEVLRAKRAAGQLSQVVLIHIGNNGTFSAEQFDEMMQLLTGVRKVVFVNVKIPRSWERANNIVLTEGVRRYPNAMLIDWHAASVDRPEFFWDDGIHLRPAGEQAYAALLAAHLKTV